MFGLLTTAALLSVAERARTASPMWGNRRRKSWFRASSYPALERSNIFPGRRYRRWIRSRVALLRNIGPVGNVANPSFNSRPESKPARAKIGKELSNGRKSNRGLSEKSGRQGRGRSRTRDWRRTNSGRREARPGRRRCAGPVRPNIGCRA